jgi:hypothetical protein
MQELIDLPFEALVNFYASDDGTNAV